MKRRLLAVTTILIIAALTACGPAPTPTMSSADLANTAVALAWTGVAMTQAALPTATATFTPLPTDTPFPTATPMPPPTIAVNVAAATATADLCNQPIPAKTVGAKTQIRFVNKSGGRADLSIGLLGKNDQGECGIYSFTIGEHESPVVEVLTGCYWAYAYIYGQKVSNAKNTAPICVEAGQLRGVSITSEFIGFD
jgi:hypothetical protein